MASEISAKELSALIVWQAARSGLGLAEKKTLVMYVHSGISGGKAT